MSFETNNEEHIQPDSEACSETVAGQEEIYLETTEEELRAVLTSEPSQTTESLRSNLEQLEVEWEVEIIHDQCE